MENRLAKEGIELRSGEMCLSFALGDTAFVGSRKFVKVTCDSLDRCNSLDKDLKSNPHLPWFLSLYPLQRPTRWTHGRNTAQAHCPLNVPSSPSDQHFLSKCLPPMGPMFPPPINRFRIPSNMQPARDPKIPSLMSLQLPPLPAQATYQ